MTLRSIIISCVCAAASWIGIETSLLTAADKPESGAAASGPAMPVPFIYQTDPSGADVKLQLREAADEFVARPKSTATRAAGQRPTLWPAMDYPEEFPELIKQTEERLKNRDLHVVRGLDATQVRALADLDYALPLLYREGSDVPIYPTNRIILSLKEGADEAALRDFAGAHGCDVEKVARGPNRYYLVVRDVTTTKPLDVGNLLHEKKELVEFAHLDAHLPMVTYAPPVIQDPLYHSHQWHLDGDTSKGAQPNSDINVETAWDTDHGPHAQGQSIVRVSILDECVEKLHPDLFPNWAAGIDLDNVPPDDDPSPDGGQRHGTACAGVAVAKGNNIGVRGACPNCGLIGVKFFGATVSEIATGFYFSVDPDDNGDHSDGAAILSNSWGFADGVFAPTAVVNSINFAANSGRNGKGCIVLFASANSDHTVNGVSALAQLPTVMAVGGTNSNAMHTEFSDVGPEVGITTPTNDRGDDGVRFSWIDITTTDNTGSSGYNGIPDNLDYTNAFGGTSSATPLAAGVLGLIFSQDPNMTAAQARAILQHNAVRIEEPYGRFDGITGHSHRLGFGRSDAGMAVASAHAGIRWPDRIKTVSVTGIANDVFVSWTPPPNDYDTSLLVRSYTPFAWMPTDGQSYTVGQQVTPGVEVIYNGAVASFTDVGAAEGGFFYGVFPRSSANRYGFGARGHIFRNGVTMFLDNSEGADPGWTSGGTNNEWQRGIPTSTNIPFSQAVGGSGPLAGTRGVRAIGGNRCWGTDLTYTYDQDTNAWLQTPPINLTGVTAPVFLEYWDWCMLETFYDRCTLEVVDANDQFVGYVDSDTGGDYDWSQKVYDLTPFAGQVIKVRWRLVSDGIFQRDGWFIDDVRIVAAAQVNLPPVARNRTAKTPQNITTAIGLFASDPNPGNVLTFVITSLPTNGQLVDPNAGAINSVPYTLVNNQNFVHYVPGTGYEGPDQFTFVANDGLLDSNTANVKVTVGTPVMVFNFPLDEDPGWAREGQWQFGQPGGQGGDPTTGFTGLFVFGYNLQGAYPDNLSVKYLTMQPLNCAGLHGVTLKFARWLGVENAAFDKATIQVSTDAVNWTTVFTNPTSDLQENAWSQQSYDIGHVADDQPFVLIRWGMGPTDTNTVFSGWNIDDVMILAIGTPSANMPPYAQDVSATTAINTPIDLTLVGSDANDDPLTYEIVSLPAGGTLIDPNAGPIFSVPYTLVAGGNAVSYEPDLDFNPEDTFLYRVNDGAIASNAATVRITILTPASFPFTEDFESGPPVSVYWTANSTPTGRIRVTNANGPIGNYHVTMDSSSGFASNELTLVIDLEGASNVLLQYDWKEFNDETHSLPASWVGSAVGDGVAISADGNTWYRISQLINGTTSYQTVLLNLDEAAAAAGISYNRTFRLRFQQYDDQSIPTDGIALDNIMLIQGTSDPLIATSALPDGAEGQPYGPLQLDAVGGDLPLTWSIIDNYGEDSFGESLFDGGVGIAQGWQADDAAFDYNLPFTFPFYGQTYTAVKVATDGWINFGAYVGSTWNNSTALLQANRRIAVMWDDLRTNVPGGDIFIDSSIAGQVTFRWQGVVRSGSIPANFSCTLFQDGRIRMNYGATNSNLTCTIGISNGVNKFFLASYNAQPALTNVDSIELQLSRLPLGMSLSSGGLLSGTPTEVGLFKPIFHIVDQSARTDTKKLYLHIPDQLFGDFDNDGDIDEDDFEQFRICYTGADAGPVVPQCEPGDSDADGDVDCVDWQAFRAAFLASSGYTPTMGIDEFVAVLLDHFDVTELERCLADADDDDVNDALDVQPYTDALMSQSP